MTQPEAMNRTIKLALRLEGFGQNEAAAELRRLHEAHESSLRTIDRKADAIQELLVQRDELHELNQELLAALEGVMYWDNGKPEWDDARAAIAKGEAK